MLVLLVMLGLVVAAPLAAQNTPPPGTPQPEAPKAETSGADAPKSDAPKTEPAKAPVNTESLVQYALGLDHMKAGRIEEAVEAFTKAAELDPTSPKILRELAAAQRANGDVAAANATLQKILALEPGNVEALHGLADSAAVRGRLEEAEGYYQKILATSADVRDNAFFALALAQYADLLSRRDRFAEAAEVLVRLLQWIKDAPESMSRHPKAAPFIQRQPQLVALAADLYLRADQVDKASQFLRTQAADDVDYHFRLARALQMRGKTDQAEKEYQAALAVEGDAQRSSAYGLALFRYAKLLESAKRPDAADMTERFVRWLIALPKDTPRDSEVAALAAYLPDLIQSVLRQRIIAGQSDKAVAFARELGDAFYSQPAIVGSLVMTLLSEKQFDLALGVAHDVQKRYPARGSPYQLLARVYEERKDTQGLVAELRGFLKDQPDHVPLKLLLARALLQTGHEDEGAKMIGDLFSNEGVLNAEDVATLVPGTISALTAAKRHDLALQVAMAAAKRWPTEESYAAVTNVLDKIKDDRRAVEALRALHAEKPDDTQLTLLLGRRLLAVGDVDEGRRLIDPLLKSDDEATVRAARLGLLDYLSKAGRDEEALKLFAEAITDSQARLVKLDDEVNDLRQSRRDSERLERAGRDFLSQSFALDDLVADLYRFVSNSKDPAATARVAKEKLDVVIPGRKRTVGADFVLGMVYEPLDRQTAEGYYRRAVETSPKFSIAYERRLAMLIGRDRLTEAVDLLSEAPQHVSQHRLDGFLLTCGALLEQLDRDADAAAVYATAVRRRPEYTVARPSLLRVLMRNGRTEEAGYVVEQALTSWPDSPSVYLAAAFYHADLRRDLSSALSALDRGLERLPDHPQLLRSKIALLLQRNRPEEALPLCDRMAKGRPDDEESSAYYRAEAEQMRATVLMEMKKFSEAEAILRTQLDDEQTWDDAMECLSGLYSRQGDEAKAEQMLRELLAKHPRHPGACNDLGYQMADRGENLAEAERMIRLAVQEHPYSGATLDSLAWVLYKQNRLGEALAAMERSLRMDFAPDPTVRDHYGDILARLGRREEAVKAYEQALNQLNEPGRREERDDRKNRAALEKKLEAARKGKDIPVAPLGRGIK